MVRIRDLAMDRSGVFGAYADVLRGTRPAPGHERDPVELIESGGALHVADGYHRIMKALFEGRDRVIATIVKRSRIPEHPSYFDWRREPDWTDPVDVYNHPDLPGSAEGLLYRALERRGLV
jgi:hypothetical protein